MENIRYREDFDLVNDIAPGKHFYQFYKSPGDLLQIIVPYFEAGVRKNNFCFWALPPFLTVEKAKEALARSIPNIDDLIQMGNFEIVTKLEWYGNGETFDGNFVLKKYVNKIKEAISRGFSIIRLTGDMSDTKSDLWPTVQEYEQKVQSQMDLLPCIVLCSYSIHELHLQQTKEVLDCHHSVLIAKV